MDKPLTTRRNGGEYSTVALPGGILETMFFPDDRTIPPRTVARTASLSTFHRQAIELDTKDQK